MIIYKFFKNKIGVSYVSTGLFFTAATMLSGFIILRWLDPTSLGKWQSFLVFIGYLQILSLGSTSGLNRELAYLIGKGQLAIGLNKLSTVGYYITFTSFTLVIVFFLISIIGFLLGGLSLETSIMFFFAFGNSAIKFQENFLSSTYRSSSSFLDISKIQIVLIILLFILLPLVYFFKLYGLIAYQTIISIVSYLMFFFHRPYKVKYSFDKNVFLSVVRIGFPMYIWNFLISVSRSLPRLVLVLFGSPYLVGLYSPAGSLNTALLALPNYVTRFIFPKMSFKFGKSNDKREIFHYTMISIGKLFPFMLAIVLILSFIIPFFINYFVPKYSESILSCQFILFSGLFYGFNNIMHSGVNSLLLFKGLRIIVFFRYAFFIVFIYISSLFFENLVNAVAFGSILAELFNFFLYYRYFRKVSLS